MLTPELRFLRPLSLQEERRLIAKLASADEGVVAEAREKLVNHNMSFVCQMARRFKLREEDFQDVFAEGLLGLAEAAMRFNPSLKVRFCTYGGKFAFGRMRHYIREHIAYRGLFNLPIGKNRLMGDIVRYMAANSLEEEEMTATVIQELTSCSDRAAEDLCQLLLNRAISLDAQDEDGQLISELIGYDDPGFSILEDDGRSLLMSNVIGGLDSRTRDVVILYAIEGEKMTAVAKRLGLNQSTAWAVYNRGIDILRTRIPPP